MKKSIFIILFLLISTNLVYANVDSNEENGIPTKDEIIQYLQIYLQTYNGLVETQKEFNNDQFFIYNKTFLINIVISNWEYPNYMKQYPEYAKFKGQLAFIFHKAEYNESRYEISQTNRSIYDILHCGDSNNRVIITGENIFYRDYTTHILNKNAKGECEYFYYVLQNDFEFIKPEEAVYSAIYNFNEEYRDLIVQKAQKIAEKNSFYENNYKELNEQNKLIHERERNGLYLHNRTLLKEDKARFEELVNQSGLSEKEGEWYSALPIPKKQILGIDGKRFEYENNLYGYILPFFILMAISTALRIKLNKIKMEHIEKFYDFISIPAIVVYFYAIKPFDIQIYEFGIILLIFIIFTFFILRYETKKRTIEK